MKLKTLEQEIMKVHSKAQSDEIVHAVISGIFSFEELVQIFISSEKNRVASQRAAWPLSYLIELHPDFIKPHWIELVKLLSQHNLHPAIHRNLLRSFQFVEIPKKFKGQIMNYCFETLTNPGASPAFKAYSISILEKMTIEFPAILPELLLILEDRYPNESPAFRSRARPILKSFSKI